MKPKHTLTAGLVIVATCLGVRSQNPAVDWNSTDGGGGVSTGGVYRLRGAIGQPDAGKTMNGGRYSLTGGFWSLFAIQMDGAPRLDVARSGLGQATISWEPNTPGFILQETSNLASGSWVNTPGSTNPINVTVTSGTKFFRLFKP